MPLIRDRDFLNEDGSIPIELLVKCITEHRNNVIRLDLLNKYYDGEHKILNRSFNNEDIPNNKIVCNHAQYISDMAVGYVFGVPISYTGENSEELNEWCTKIDEDSHNNELALDISVFGVGYELVYMNNEQQPFPELAVLNPCNTFTVVDNSVKHEIMFAVTYTEKRDINDILKGYDVMVYTSNEIYHYLFSNLSDLNPQEVDLEEHFFGEVPIIEYWNNKKQKGDFEPVTALIDAYNLLQSDRLNDKEQLVDAILAVINASFGDDEKEMTETEKFLKEHKILELPRDADAKWLTKQLNETEVEVLKKALKDDIHEFSKVPCLTDENFVGNSSGIAMKYKLIGFEQLGRTKERYFKRGLRTRNRMLSNINYIRLKGSLEDVDITMKRSLPVDEETLANIAQLTKDLISWETRLLRFDPEIDVEEEKKKLDKEKDEAATREAKIFGSYDFNNANTNEDNVDEE